MKIAILGVGALGSLFAAKLSTVADVMMIGNWPEQLAAVRQNGITLISPEGDETRYSVPIGVGADVPGAVDVVLVLVKSHQTAAAASVAGRLLGQDGLAITLQNGLGNLETLAEALGAWRVTLGVTSEGATMVGPGLVRYAGRGATVIGRPATLGYHQLVLLEALTEQLTACGLATSTTTGTDGLLWGKLAVSAAINPLTALLRVPNGALLAHGTLRAILSAAAEEVAALAAANGIALPFPDVAAQAAHVAYVTADNRSSMLQDIERGAQTEVNAICGAVVRAAASTGVAVPVNSRLLGLIQQTEAGTLPALTTAAIETVFGEISFAKEQQP